MVCRPTVLRGMTQLLLVFVPEDLVSPRESRTPGFSSTPEMEMQRCQVR